MAFFLLGRLLAGLGLGEDTRGGGVATRWICEASLCREGAGGVGRGGAVGAEVLFKEDFSDALE